MEEILIRFPAVGENIFKQLDNKDLVVCKTLSKTWYNFLDIQEESGSTPKINLNSRQIGSWLLKRFQLNS